MQNDIQDDEIQQPEMLRQLISDLGIESLPKDQQNELIIKMTEVLIKRIFLETMDSLDEQGREDYEKMTQENVSPEQVEVFFKERIKNYDEMIQKIIEEFKQEMLASNK